MPAVSLGQAVEGTRVRAVNGDSFEILVGGVKQREVRLNNIDAPELAQPHGQEAKAALAAIIETQSIRIVPFGVDQYGRTLAEVWVGERLINKVQVETGNAWAFRPILQDQSYLPLQEAAKAAKLGLWAEANPVPPWDYRAAAAGRPSVSVQNGMALRTLPRPSTRPQTSTLRGQCLGKRYCSQMSSCSEAQFYLSRCGVTTIDGDNDGKACELTCGH